MLADAHIHLFRRGLTGGSADGAELREYVAIAERRRVDHALVVAYQGAPSTSRNNDEVLAATAEHPWLHPTAFLDLADPPSARGLAAMLERVRGLSLYPPAEASLSVALSAAHLREIDRAAAIVSLNVPGSDFAAVGAFAADVPRATILLSHLGGAYERPGRMPPGLRELAALPNVAVKLSGLYAMDPMASHLAVVDRVEATLDAFGPGRLLWGSDYAPVLARLSEEQAFTPPAWLDGLVSPGERTRMLHGNLVELLAAGE